MINGQLNRNDIGIGVMTVKIGLFQAVIRSALQRMFVHGKIMKSPVAVACTLCGEDRNEVAAAISTLNGKEVVIYFTCCCPCNIYGLSVRECLKIEQLNRKRPVSRG